jgi:hypothetical protein
MTLPKHYPVTRVHARVTSIIQRCVISVIQLCAEVNKRGDRIGNEGGKPRLQIAANASWPRILRPTTPPPSKNIPASRWRPVRITA